MPSPQGKPGALGAWHPVAQKKVGSIDHRMPLHGGTLSTSDPVFYGDMEGQFNTEQDQCPPRSWYVIGPP